MALTSWLHICVIVIVSLTVCTYDVSGVVDVLLGMNRIDGGLSYPAKKSTFLVVSSWQVFCYDIIHILFLWRQFNAKGKCINVSIESTFLGYRTYSQDNNKDTKSFISDYNHPVGYKEHVKNTCMYVLNCGLYVIIIFKIELNLPRPNPWRFIGITILD